MSTISQDLRFSFRQLRKSPAFTITAVLTLALGIGATTAIFSLVYQVLLRSMPVSHPEQIYKIGKQIECCVDGGMQNDWRIFSYDLYKQFRDHTPGTDGMIAVEAGSDNVSARSEHEESGQPLDVRFVSGNYFSVLGVRSFAGRLLRPEDDQEGAAPVAVVSHAIWEAKFHSDPHLVGSTLLLTGHPVTVVGISADGFLGERNTGDPAGVWMTIAQEPVLEPERKLRSFPAAHWLDILVRIPNAREVPTIEKSLQTQLVQWIRANRSPGDNYTEADIARQTTELARANGGINDLADQYEQSLKLLLLIAGAVLLICCANLANLMLVRAMGRRQEISIRTALGAPKARLIRQMLTEAIVVALAGGTLAVVLAYVGIHAILGLAMKGVQLDPLSAKPSLPVLLFTLGVSILTGVLFGIAPAWVAARSNPVEALRGASRSVGRSGNLSQRILVVLQAALSVALLSVTGLLLTSLRQLEHQDFHFQPEGRLIVFTDLQAAGYHFDQLSGLYRRFDESFASLPAIQSFAYGTYGPMAFNNWGTGVAFPGGDPMAKNYASYLAISPQFFDAVGTRILLGRPVTDQDTSTSTHVAVVNKAFVDKFLKGKPPIGEHFGPDSAISSEYEIVGVADNTKYANPADPTQPMFFTPITQLTKYDSINAQPERKEQAEKNEQYEHFASNLIFRYRGDSASAANAVRATLHSIDPGIPILRMMTYSDQVSKNFTQQELVVRLTTLFGILALILAAVGLYGVTAYSVERRTGEIGVRMALGSTRSGILALVLRSALAQALVGLVLGLPLALGAGRLLRSTLYQTSNFQPLLLLAVTALLFLAAVIATIVPARRAASIEPATALRTD